MKKKLCAVAGAVLAVSLAAAGAGEVSAAEKRREGVAICGSVKKEAFISYEQILKYPVRRGRFKVAGNSCGYLGSFECEGADLSDLLAKAGVAKKAADGFDRELDMYVVVSGRSGSRAVYSYGEAMLSAASGGFLLSARTRPIYPHKHSDLAPLGWKKEAWTAASRSRKVDLAACASCHAEGEEKPPVYIPKGACLFPAAEGDARFVEDVYEISVRQAPKAVEKAQASGKKEAMFVEAPALALPDGKSAPIGKELLSGLERVEFADDTVGMGKGFHGTHRYAGVPLSAVIGKVSGKRPEPALFYALVTAADGYRCILSGGEIFMASGGRGVVLVDCQDGQPMEAGEGRYKIYVRGDFFVDRCIRSVARIECFVAE